MHLFMVAPERLRDSSCPRCAHNGRDILRHREHVTLDCLDCAQTNRVEVAPWNEVRCPNCMSTRLNESDSAIEPPLPSQFGELGERLTVFLGEHKNKEHPWGVDGVEDALRIAAEVRSIEDEPDFYRHVFVGAMFARSLLDWAEYGTADDYYMMLTVLGNLERQFFNATGELGVGLDAVAMFEAAVEVAPDDANRASTEHNVAMAINSLLIKYPEDGLEEATGRANLQQVAIDAASRALSLYEAVAADEPDGMFRTGGPAVTGAQQSGRVHFLIGDLLAHSPTDDDHVREAIAHYELALDSGLPDVMLDGLRAARATALMNLSEPTEAELRLAAGELEDLTP
jgi:hypothetical protein